MKPLHIYLCSTKLSSLKHCIMLRTSRKTMSEESQRVLVIQDASRDVSYSAIKWTLQGLSLKPGDKLTLLAVIHQVKTPSTLSIMGSRKLCKHSCFYLLKGRRRKKSKSTKRIVIECIEFCQ